MKTEKATGVIIEIGGIEQIASGGSGRKQVIIIKEPGFVHKTDTARNGMDNFFKVELWNASIEKFNIQANYKNQQQVEVTFWVNGKYHLVGSEHKYEHDLALKSIRPL